ncbi:class III lanthipeptide [Paenibacillus sp. FSL W7-1088]|uniref:class III lanthipeptide n=1 Tax=Paenibacillus sp. FSL W7-1088 TaxID=2921695 RepID=UPI0030EE9FAD
MNDVLELQKLAHDVDGKGQAMEITPISTTITWTVTGTTTVSTALSTVSHNNC